MRDISLVPNFTSEYKAQNVHKFVVDKLPKNKHGILDTEDFVKATYILIANSISIIDLKTYGHLEQTD